jgi:hypothetical protein
MMSHDLTAIQNLLPDEIRQQLAAEMAADVERLGSLGGKDAIRVTQDKKFELPNGDIQDELTGIVVDFVYRNEYYLSAFNRKEIRPPACFAINPDNSLLAPSDKSPLKQSDEEAGGCATCQQNQYGTSTSGDGKACKNTVLLAVLPPDANEETPLWVVKSSPTAIKYWNQYVTKISRAKVPVRTVLTRMYFDPNSTYASLRFDLAGPNPALALATARLEEARHRLMQEPDVSTFELPTTKKK